MWITFVTKCTAIATASLVAAGIVWAGQQGGQAGDAGTKAAATTRIGLQVSGDKANQHNQNAASAVKPDATQLQSALPQPSRELSQKLDIRFETAWTEMAARMDKKAKTTSELEMAQLEKAELQKKAEHLQGWLAELDTPAVDSSGKELSQGGQAERIELYDTVAQQLERIKIDLRTQILKRRRRRLTSSAQMEVAQRQREVDELCGSACKQNSRP